MHTGTKYLLKNLKSFCTKPFVMIRKTVTEIFCKQKRDNL